MLERSSSENHMGHARFRDCKSAVPEIKFEDGNSFPRTTSLNASIARERVGVVLGGACHSSSADAVPQAAQHPDR
jgi:hypothetical protein